MVDHIAATGELPVQVPGVITPYRQEGSQPPLYYLISAVLIAPIDRSDLDALRQPNPHAKAGIPGALDNKNLVLHATPHPPIERTALAVYLLRGFSILLGCVTIVAVYGAARQLGPPSLALLAAGLTAFNPMFIFIAASVNNDNLVTALNSLIIWQMLLMLRDGFTTRRSILIAVLIALATLSKLSGLVLVPVVALAALWIARRDRSLRGLIILGVLMAGIWALGAGGWYLRNLTLYGELFGTATMVAVAGPRLEPFGLATLLSEFEGFRIAYWGLFGAVNLMTVEIFYRIMDALTLLALIGLLVYVWRQRADQAQVVRVGLLGLTLLIGFASVIAWTAQTYASQGRLLFPFVAATSPLLALGVLQLSPARQMVARVGVGSLGAFSLIVPFATIAPPYAPPPPRALLPETANPVYARFGDVALIGYTIPERRYEPGAMVPVTVYWQVIERSERDLSLYLHAISGGADEIGKIDSFPGGGRLRTSTWTPGAIYADHYAIPLDSDATGRSRLRVQVGWWHFPTEALIPAVDAQGGPLVGQSHMKPQ
ncbi:MAG: hypothetical protein GYB67_06785 [Chloroflexi bacterium]|nr:hypothetical protein [Chloroflexota bacterium]